MSVEGSEDKRSRRPRRPRVRRSRTLLLPGLLARAVERDPQAVAVVDDGVTVNYAELDARSSRLARYLIGRGAGPEAVVAVGMRRSLESVVAVWAVAKTGAAFLPVDPDYPEHRIRHMLEDSGATSGITSMRARSFLPDSADWVVIDDDNTAQSILQESAEPIVSADRVSLLLPEHPAYLIYTSGSTGLPKGVAVTHSGLEALSGHLADQLELTPGARTLHFVSPSFDASILEYLIAFSAASTMVLASPDIYGGEELRGLLERQRVTHAFFTPGVLASLDPAGLDAVRVMVVGGEAFGPELVEKWASGRSFFNAYGPTETTIVSNMSEALTPGMGIALGRSVPGFQARVLDARLNEVPAGVAGELHLSGPGVARGYLGRRGLTAGRFVADPSGDSGARMYRTGDVVRRDSTGSLTFLGRSDFQVKVRGFRVELGEIDSALTALDDVQFALTKSFDDGGNTTLVSYVLSSENVVVDGEQLRRSIGEMLPTHMVPTAVVQIERIPLTPAGKVDRNALFKPQIEARDYREPTTATETVVAEVYAAVLGRAQVSADDDFFELGGNSLIGTQVAARVGRRLNKRVPAKLLFEDPTVSGLARLIDDVDTEEMSAPLIAVERPERIPLSFAQQRIWFLNRFDPGSSANNIPVALRLSGALDVSALARAVYDVLVRHESLRTMYPELDGIAHQQILDASDVPLSLDPVAVLPSEVHAAVHDRVATGFDLATSVPLRVDLLQLSPTEHVLVMTVHHIAADGFSIGPLTRDVMTAYGARLQGVEPGWAPLPVQYADFAVWQRTVLGEESDPDSDSSKQLSFWRSVLADPAPPPAFPVDVVRPKSPSQRGSSTTFHIDTALASSITDAARRYESSVFMLAHTALALVLSRSGAVDDVVIGTAVAGRGEAELDGLVGMFVNTVALRTSFDQHATVAATLAYVRGVDLDAFEHTDVPFERIVDAVAPERDPSRHPIFQVMLTLQNMGSENLELPGLTISGVDADLNRSEFDLALTLSEDHDENGALTGLQGLLVYATDLFDEHDARIVVDRFVRLLEFLCRDGSVRLADAPFADAADSAFVDAHGRGGELVEEQFTDLFSAFEQQALRTPDAVAVRAGNEVLSYAALRARVTALASALVRRGVGPEDRVAVAIVRSVDAVVAVYAVMAVGAAYVPIDTGAPDARNADILDTVRPALTLVAGSDVTLPGNSEQFDITAVEPDSGHSFGTGTSRSGAERAHLAYVIFTSGSTGQPRGVAVEHGAVHNQMNWLQQQYPLGEVDSVLFKTPMTFDASVWELFWPLRTGASIVVARPDGHRDPDYLVELIARERITVAQFVPSFLTLMNEMRAFGRTPSLRHVFSGGEQLTTRTASVIAGDSNVRLHNLYGPTETTVQAVVHDHSSDGHDRTVGANATVVPIGKPVSHTVVRVLDAMLRPVPPGVVGELYIAGVQLARGYHGRPDITAQRFVANPFDTSGGRLYRTGDAVYWSAEGDLVYLGRTDTQIKVHGQRIELGEIEAALSSVPGVLTAAAAVRSNRLVGYVVGTGELDGEAVRSATESVLPEHMVPAVVVVLHEMPLTTSGKLDRRALPDPVTVHETTSREAESEFEVVIAEVFSDVLHLDSIGMDDSFFALGGDSIMSIQLVSRARARGVEFSPRDVFEQKTVARLAASAIAAADQSKPVLEELPGGGVGPRPLLPIERHCVERAGYSRFTQNIVLELPIGVERSSLVATLTAVVDHHDALRSRLVAASDDVAGSIEVSPPGDIDVDALVHRIDVSGHTVEDSRDAATHALDAALGRLAPGDGVMLQFVWLDFGPDRTGRLVFVAHHFVVDGVSWRILVPDLVVAWNQVQAATVPTLPPVTTSVRAWAHAATEEARSDARTAELPMWEHILSGPDPDIGHRPLDPRIDVASTVRQVTVSVPVDVTTALTTTVPERFRTGVNDGLLTALALAVSVWRRKNGDRGGSTLVQLEGHGREQDIVNADLSRTVGWFTSIVPVRLDLGDIDVDDALRGGDATGAALKAVKEQLLALPDRGIGFGLLRYCNADTAEVLQHHDVGQISFNYLGKLSAGDVPSDRRGLGWLPADDLQSLEAARDKDMPAGALIDINAIVVDSGDGASLEASFSYPENAVSRDDVDEIASLWLRALDAVTTHASAVRTSELTPSDVPLVSVTQTELNSWEGRYHQIADVWSLSPLQEGLLFHARLAENSVDVYTMQVVLDLTGSVQEDLLRTASRVIVDRYPNLRAAFHATSDGSPIQVIVADVEVPWRSEDVTGLSGDRRTDAVREILAQEQRKPFDLSEPPLIRFALIEVAQGQWKFAVTNHHILTDGWSVPLLMKDLLVLYATRGDASLLPRVGSYRSFLAWLGSRDRAASSAAWSAALDGLSEPTLMASAPRADRAISSRADEYEARIDAETTANLAEIAGRLGVTLNTVVQTAWGLLLGRMTGREDVVFGATVSGRPAELTGVETMVGLFINTLPVRIRIGESDTIASVAMRVQAEQADLIDHHYVGLADITRNVGIGPLFDTLVVFESYPVDEQGLVERATSIGDMSVTGVSSNDNTHYPVTLAVSVGVELNVQMKFLHGLFDETSMQALLRRFVSVIQAIAADPHAPVAGIEVVDTDELGMMFGAWNDTDHDVNPSTLLVAFHAAAAATPDATALHFENDTVTYREFSARVNAVASVLIDAGVGPESLVALAMSRSIELVVGMYAILEAGGAFVPIDPAQPRERNEYVLGVSEPVCILTRTDDDFVGDGSIPVKNIDLIDTTVVDASPISDEDRLSPLLPTSVAYVIFTSGSTGRPKGVAVSHQAIDNQMSWFVSEYSIGADDVYLQKTATTFDVSLWGFFAPLRVGGAVVLATPDGHRDGSYLSVLVADKRVTLTDFVPTMLSVFVETAEPSQITALRAVFVIGEALPADTIRSFVGVASAQLHNLYGPTEAAVSITAAPVGTIADGAVPIGRPVWNSRVVVLDSRLRPVPIGSPGELYLAGSQLARGYLHRPDLTADRFVANPYARTPGESMYRTGDLVRYSHDGQLYYLGRTDYQVKFRGQRIELEEIEVQLLEHSTVRNAVVVARSIAAGEHLVAYVVADSDVFDSAVVSSALSERLPKYMVPTAFVVLDRFPLNTSGKLDRNALPEPTFSSAAFRAPETAAQQVIAATMQAVLDCGRVGLDDNFFELGGNSLSATRLAARLSVELGTSVPVRVLFEAPSVENLAASVGSHGLARPPLVPMQRPDRIPLSPAQRRMWFLGQFEPLSVADNMPSAIRLTGDLNVDALAAAVVDLVDRHESLRTVYPASDGIGYQHILSAIEAPVDLTLRDDDFDSLTDAAKDFFGRAFDITAEVPIRAALLRFGPRDHVLFVVVHHIAADGFSMGPLARDVMQAYVARTRDSAPSWAPLPVQYADYTLWQRGVLGSVDDPNSLAAQQDRYWRAQLEGFDGVARLPVDRPRPATASGSGSRVAFTIDASLYHEVETAARAVSCTPFMMLHAAVAVLLSRVTGSADVAVGTPVAGRGEAALDDVIGMFVNTLVLRTDVRPALSFAELLEQVRRVDIDAFEHSDLPFEDVVDAVDPPRIDGLHPLVQVMLAFENLAPTTFELPDLEVTAVDFDAVASKMDLQFTFTEITSESGESRGLTGSLVYATDLFEASTAQALCRRLVIVLDQVTADASRPIGGIDVLERDETLHLRALATPQPIAIENTGLLESTVLLETFDDVAARFAEQTALAGDDESWSYEDFAAETNRLTRYLIARGVGSGDRVGIALARTPRAVIAVCAVLKCGAAYVPLDPDHPDERLLYMIETSGAALVLSTTHDRASIPGGGVEMVHLDTVHTESFSSEPVPESELLRTRHDDDPAYVVFTSGSTGRPKGVVVSHRSVTGHVHWLVRELAIDSSDSVFVKTPMTFDASVWELFAGLMVGARIVIAAPDGHRDPQYLAATLKEQKVTIAQFVPSMLASVLEWVDDDPQCALRTTVVGGEPLPAQVAAAFARLTGSDVVNVYGPTETTVQVTARRVREIDRGIVPLGDPVPGTGLLVLDSGLNFVPVGVVGELYIAGGQLAQGYAARPGLTAERFVANPFDFGARLYRTGDLVRRTSGGELEFHGRSDLQVKLRGQRVELGEVEAVLGAHPGVTQAVAAVRSDRLVGYLVGSADRSDVDDFARSRLATYMVPSAWVFLDEMPTTTSGKIDRASLPDPERELRAFRAPTSPVEQAVARVLEDVLGVDRVGLDDEFFALGGNSLTATQVVARLNNALDRRVPLRLLFETSTVGELSGRIDATSGRNLPPLTRQDRPDRIPLSLAQQRMWFLNRLDSWSAVDNIPVALRLAGPLNLAALERSINDVVHRHESLRTVYPDIDGVGYQRILRPDDVAIEFDVRSVDSDDVMVAATEFFARGFDVTSELPLRTAVMQLPDGDHVLLVVAHHIAADGFSMRPLTRDLMAAYASRAGGEAPLWDSLPVHYADFTLWQREVLGRSDDPRSLLAEQERFWTQALDGYSGRVHLPTSGPRPRVASGHGATHIFAISQEVRSSLDAIAAENRSTPFMVLHAALAALLARLSNDVDVAVGTPTAGRGERALDDMVGMFVNTLVLRTVIDPGSTFEDLVSEVRGTDIAAFEHAELPFERVVELSDPERSQAWHPLVQVLFSFQNVGSTSFDLPDLSITAVDFDAAVAKMDLQVTVGERSSETGNPDGYSVQLTYATDVFSASSIQDFGRRFSRILNAVTDDPKAIVGDIDILGAHERAAILTPIGSPVPVDLGHTVLEAFDRSVRRDPDAVALVSGDRRVTYAEFDGLVDGVATSLRGRGVGQESRVVVALERSVNMVVAVYAVLRVGGAYVPIDPTQPPGRNSYIVDAVRPDLVFVQKDHWFDSPLSVSMESVLVGERPAEEDTASDVSVVPHPDNLAYVLFTSGSTGRPKGVAVSHSSVVNQLAWMISRFELTSTDVVLWKTPATFDVSVWELFVPLAVGATMVVAEPDGHRDPMYLAATIAEQGVTAVSFVPSMLSVFVSEMRPDSMDSVRNLFVAGEAMTLPLVRSVARVVGLDKVHNLYGPTECTVHATAYTVSPHLGSEAGIPIGTPVARTRTHVLDSRLRPVPTDVVGELYLGGVQVARGYERRPDLTSERFVADPFDNTGGRLYRTGDLVRRTDSGDLVYVRRLDNQVKLRGQRVEMGEIEALLAELDSVDRAAVDVRDDRLVAYVVAKATGPTIVVEDLKTAVKDVLPKYMVPGAFVVLDELPMTANGKLDRASLPEPARVEREFRAPHSRVQRAVAAVFVEVLGVAGVGLDDDFFDMGGNSLIAAQVVSRVGRALALVVPLRLLFADSTVEGFARAVEDDAEPDHRAPLVARERPVVVPLSVQQQQTWTLSRWFPESGNFNIPIAVRLSGALNSDALTAAMIDVVTRHESLRTIYPVGGDDQPTQVVLPPTSIFVDLEPVRIDESDVAGRIAELTGTGFDVTSTVPLRTALLHVGESEFVLVVVFHHISADGSSLAPFARDLTDAYFSRLAGEAPDWTPLALQYADYTLWQRATLGDPADPASQATKRLNYWRNTLAGLPDALDVPLDRQRPEVRTMEGGTTHLSLDAELHSAIDRIAREAGATRFMAVHAAMALTLASSSGKNDIAIGTPTAGRGSDLLDPMVGMFVSTVVLRTPVDTAGTFSDLLADVRTRDVSAFDNAGLPLEWLIRDVMTPRPISQVPFFQVLMAFQNYEQQVVGLDDLGMTFVDSAVKKAKLDLHFSFVESLRPDGACNGLSIQIDYAAELFDEATVVALGERLRRVLAAVVDDPHAVLRNVVSTIDTVPSRSTEPSTDTAPAVGLSVLNLFDANVRSRPDDVAVVHGDEVFTYAEFDRCVDAVASALTRRGVTVDSRVGVSMRRSARMVAALYGVLRAGAAYVPLDPDQPVARTGYILDVTRPVVVITDDESLLHSAVPFSSLSADYGVNIEPAHSDTTDGAHLAYVLFTSGSTGRPKGVAVTHAAVVNQMAWMIDVFGLSDNDVVLQKTPFTFDVSVWELFCALACGGRLVIADPDGHRDPRYLLDVIERYGVSATSFVPSMLAMFDADPGAATSTVRHLFVAGEAFSFAAAKRARTRFPAAEIHNLYGPTEFTVHATWHTAAADFSLTQFTDAMVGDLPIGLPVRNTAAYVLDGRLHPVPIGVAGELYLGGVQSARGYFGRPDLTAGRFVADPFGASGRLYRTGDLVRWDDAGKMHFLGRTDFMVKLRGQRIELGEIEASLSEVPAVRHSVVLVREDRLVAYVVPRGGSSLDVDGTRDWLKTVLPAYMVPSAIVVLDVLPVNASGKLDRAALPTPVFEATEYRAPTTPTERVVAGVFGDVLGVDEVGVNDDFFLLGGNSLIATRVIGRIGDELGVSVPLRLLFEASTVEAIAHRIDNESVSMTRPALVRRTRPARIPLAPTQEMLWSENRRRSDAVERNVLVAVRLAGELNLTALRDAVADVLNRHESLRTVYPEAGGDPHQHILEAGNVALDLDPRDIDESWIASAVEQVFGRGFDVAAQVPLRVRLLRVSETDHVLVIVVHHITADGFSMRPLTADIVVAYTARIEGRQPEWPQMNIQYADFALWQREVLGEPDDPTSVAHQQLSYWLEQLQGLKECGRVPVDHNRPNVSTFRGGSVDFTIPGATRAKLDDLARAHDSTLFMVVHAAAALVLAHLSGSPDIAIRIPIAGRGGTELDKLIGKLNNSLILRTTASTSSAFAEVLTHTRDVDLTAFANADVPLDQVLGTIDPNGILPPVQATLSFQNLGWMSLQLPGLQIEPIGFDTGIAKYELQFVFYEATEESQGRDLLASVLYSEDVFGRDTAVEIGDLLQRVLSAVAEDASSPVGDVLRDIDCGRVVSDSGDPDQTDTTTPGQ